MSLKSNSLIYKNYTEHQEIRKDVEPLFISAFPRDERPDEETYFSNFLTNENAVLWGFYDNDEFVGFLSFVLYKDICYLFFLAIVEDKRNQGYGTAILSTAKEVFKDRVMLLCYEEVDDKYEDNEMRKKRERLYHRLGYIDNGYKTNEFGVIFQTAYNGKHKVPFEDYWNIFKIGFRLTDEKFLKKHLKQVQ